MNKASFVSPSVEKETIESLSQKLLEVNRQLTEANRELKRVQSEKEEMLSNISHDLRAPITAIRSALDYLNSGQEISMEDYIASLQLIDRRTQTLENLIQDMYYLFCVEDTSRELELVTLEAAPFLEEYFYDMISDKRYDDHDMVLDLPENLSCKFSVDVQKMIRVLDNLFTNAAKYSGTGSRITIDELSRRFLMNPSTMKEVFKTVYGQSIAAHIREHRMERAAELLRETDASMAEIAAAIGYESASKFSAEFRKAYGALPTEYRRAARAEKG